MRYVEKKSFLEKPNAIYIYDTETKEKIFLEYDMIGNFPIGINRAWNNNSPASNYFRHSDFFHLPISDRFKKVKYFSDGMMCIGKIFPTGITINGKDAGDKKYGYIDETGKVTIPTIYDEVYPFSDGRAKVILNGRTGIITRDGHFIVEVNDKEILVSGYEWAGKTYDNKAILVSRGGKEGLLDLNCDVITPLEYSLCEMKPFGYMAISRHDESGLTGLIDTEGKIVVDCKYKEFGIIAKWNRINNEECVYEPSEGYCIMQQTNGMYGYYNLEAHEAYPCVFEDAKPFSEGLACVQRQGKYGYINHKGETVIDYAFEDGFPFEGRIARVVLDIDGKGKCYALINKKGELITNHNWRKIRNFHEGFAAANDGEIHDETKRTFINEEGKPISSNRYYEVGDFQDGKAGVDFFRTSGIIIGEKQYQGMISKEGCVEKKNPLTGSSIVIPPDFQDALFPKEGILAIKKDGKFGFADESFDIIIPNKFTKVESFSGEWGKVWQNKYWTFIDKKGKYCGIISSSDYDLAIKLKEKLFIVEKNKKWGIINQDGKVLLPVEYENFRPSRTKFFDYPKGFGKGNFSFILFQSSTDYAIYCVKSDAVHVSFESVIINEEAALVVNNGKYGFIGIDGKPITPIIYQNAKPFKNGFAALQKKDKWGLIDIKGSIILPFVYERINNDYYEISCVKDNIPELYKIQKGNLDKVALKFRNVFSIDESPTYNRYKGSYVQDEMGYSDDDIDTIFDGDPDAYWNID